MPRVQYTRVDNSEEQVAYSAEFHRSNCESSEFIAHLVVTRDGRNEWNDHLFAFSCGGARIGVVQGVLEIDAYDSGSKSTG